MSAVLSRQSFLVWASISLKYVSAKKSGLRSLQKHRVLSTCIFVHNSKTACRTSLKIGQYICYTNLQGWWNFCEGTASGFGDMVLNVNIRIRICFRSETIKIRRADISARRFCQRKWSCIVFFTQKSYRVFHKVHVCKLEILKSWGSYRFFENFPLKSAKKIAVKGLPICHIEWRRSWITILITLVTC